MKKSSYHLSALLLCSCFLWTQCATSKKAAESTPAKAEAAPAASQGNVGITFNTVKDISPEDLQGKWEFDYFTNVSTNKKILFPVQMPYLSFDTKRKKFSGMAGCNNVSGDYTMNGDQFYFKQPMVITRMNCNVIGEKTMIQYMTAVDKVSITENVLQLMSNEKAVMVFKRVE
jgi:heat shock protein HslJ